jgi:DNA polymerase-4
MAAAEINWMFVDLNSYFASVEQELCPELRGQPIAIIPIEPVDSACCIAVSYQAKAYGVKTGFRVMDAKTLCPHIILVAARPKLYVDYHHRVAAAIEKCIPIHSVLSCDEFSCQLMGSERTLRKATCIAYAIKNELRRVGATLRCSVGLAPNRLLAKIAGDMLKPDGLMILQRKHLPHALYSLKIEDIPGIGSQMEQRVHVAGIETMQQLCALPRDKMHAIWGSVLGDRLYLWLKGEDFLEPPARPLQSISRQHILPPKCRIRENARGVAFKMLHACGRRMRRQNLWTGGMALSVGFYNRERFDGHFRIPPCQDTFTLQEHLLMLWERVPDGTLSDMAVTLTHLDTEPYPDLFGFNGPTARDDLIGAVDRVNARYGLNTVYLGSIHNVRKEVPTRIPFGPPPPLEEFEDAADRE